MKTLDEDYAEVSFNPFLNSVVIKWKEVSTLNECQQALIAVLETVNYFNSNKIVSDMSFGNCYSGLITDWLKIEFIPKLTTHGVRKIAFLIESSNPHKFFLEKVKKDAATMGNLFRIFHNQRDLEIWLKDYDLIRKTTTCYADAARFGYFL